MTPLTRAARALARTAPSVHGAALTFETLLEGDPAAARLRPAADTLLRVIAGPVRVTVGAEARLLATGEEIVIPAGAAHRLESTDGEARLVSGLRAARRR